MGRVKLRCILGCPGLNSSYQEKGLFQASLFFYEKILNAQKRKSNKNQLTKQKQTNKKQQRQQVITHNNF